MAINGEVVANSNSGSLSIENLPKGVLRAIIERLNEKSQRSTKIYQGSYAININHLKNLFTKIGDEFSGRLVISESANVSLALDDNARHDFRSWEEFELFDQSQAEKTKSLSFEYTIDSANHQGEVQRYKTQVSVQNTPSRFGLMLGPIRVQSVSDFGIPPVPIHASVEYTDFIIGKNLITTIDKWEKSLPRREPIVPNWISKNSDKFQLMLEISTTLASIAACRFYTQIWPSQQYPGAQFPILLTTAATIFVGFHLGRFFSSQMQKNIVRVKTASNITITSGDSNYDSSIKSGNRNNARRAIGLFIGCVLQVALGLAGNQIWDYVNGN